MSAETTPTSIDLGMSRPLATRLVPTRTSSPARGERVEDPLRGALALDDVAVQAADPETREPLADLALDPLRATAEVADPRRAAVRAAGGEGRPGRSDGSGASFPPGGRRAGGRSPGRPGPSRSPGTSRPSRSRDGSGRGSPDPLIRVEPRQRLGERVRDQPTVPRRQLLAQVHGLTTGSAPAARTGSTDRRYRPERGPSSPPPASRSRAPRRRPRAGRVQRRVASLEPGRPVALVGRVVLLVHDDQPDVRQRRSRASPRPDDEVRLTGADPAPLVGTLTLAQGRMQDGDPDRGSARSRSTIGKASAISGTRRGPAGRRPGTAAMAST